MRFRFLPLVLAVGLAAVAVAAQAAPPPPNLAASVPRWVDMDLAIDQPDLRTLRVGGDLLVYRHDVDGDVYDADDLGAAYRGINKYQGRASGDAFVADLEAEVRAALAQTLAASFPGADVSGVSATVDRSTLQAASGNRFDPPVRVAVAADVARTSEQVGLGTLSDAAVAAVFHAGASVEADFALSVRQGYAATYRIGVPASPAGLRFASAQGGAVSADGLTLTLSADNTAGRAPVASVTVVMRDAVATPPSSEDVRTSVRIALGELLQGAPSVPIGVAMDAEVRSLDVQRRFPGALPDKVSLSHVSGEALRALHQTGAVTDQDLAAASQALVATLRASLQQATGAPVTVSGAFGPEDLARPATPPYAADEPLGFHAQGSAERPVPGDAAEHLDLALLVGAEIGFDLALAAQEDGLVSYTVEAPPGAVLARADGAALAPDGRSATVSLAPGAPPALVSFAIRGADAPSYDEERAELGVLVDLQDLQVTLGGAAGGDFGDLLVDVTVTGSLHVIALPPEMAMALPDDVTLAHVSSDAIRLLVERGLVTDAQLAELEARLLDEVATNLGRALGGDVAVTGGLDRATLAAGIVASPPSDAEPVVFTAHTRFLKPLDGGPLQPQAAIALYTQQQAFTLPRVQGLDTAYTIVLPRGLAVTGMDADGGTVEQGKAEDGRDQVVVRPTGDSATATMSMAVTPTFVLLKFWPLVLLAVLVLVLLVGTPIALVAMRRKRRKE